MVDDEPLNIQALFEIFQNQYEIFMATNGQEAIKQCQENPPDIVLLDIVMPGMDGLEVCKHLKKNAETNKIPVIFVTAQTTAAEESRGLAAGAVDFITKPINPSVVRARVGAHLLLKQQSDILRSMAFIDGLTGIPNRRQFDERLTTEWKSHRRTGAPLALVMIDVDHFKSFNDQYGHLKGDTCLQRVAEALQETAARPRDLVARYGGEEFGCLLPETDLEGAINLCQKFLDAVRELDIPHAQSGSEKKVTVSAGIAACIPKEGQSERSLLKIADQRLYKAKQAGRNRMVSTDSD